MDFLSLPLQIVCEILSKYLYPNELAKFDTSVCNSTLRPKLLNEIFVDTSFFFWTDKMAVNRVHVPFFNYYISQQFHLQSFLVWFQKRELSIRKFNFQDFNYNKFPCTISYFWNRLSIRALMEMHHFNFRLFTIINNDDLEIVTSNCPRTTWLNLSSCRSINNDGICFIARLQNLVALNVSNCYVGPLSLIFIAQQCVHLQFLWWDMCNGALTSENSVFWFDQRSNASLLGLVDVLGENNSDLRLISFQCTEFHKKFSVSLSGISKISIKFPLLTSLLLNGTVDFGDDGAREIGLHCPNLKVLGLYKETGLISNAGVMPIAQGCTQLVEVNLGGHSMVQDNSIIAMANACKKLKRCYLHGTSVENKVMYAFPAIEMIFRTYDMSSVFHDTAQQTGSVHLFEDEYKKQF